MHTTSALLKTVSFVSITLLAGVGFADVGPRPHLRDVITPIQIKKKPAGEGKALTPKHRILYLDRGGGTLNSGADDPPRGVTSAIPGLHNAKIGTFPFDDATWTDLVTCVTETYARFSMEVTDVRPPDDVDYIETIVAGKAEDLGLDPLTLGVAGMSLTCNEVNERGVDFAFAGSEYMLNDDRKTLNVANLCWTVAQESAHSLSLDHEYLCADPMTYLDYCGFSKEFQDVDSQCGTWDVASACLCGTPTQNSVQQLLTELGPSDHIPPTVTIDSPTDGSTVNEGFTVDVTPTDENRVDHVTIEIDGASVGTLEHGPWTVTTPVTLAPGSHTITVTAVDGGANEASATATVTLAPACSTDADCGPQMKCQDGVCYGDVGATCTDYTECATGLCFNDTAQGTEYCSVMCDSDAVCPTGFRCAAPHEGSEKKCLAETAGSPGGGCSASPATGGRGAAGVIGLFFVGLAFATRRRRA
jgi:MYXO-CTERM domain-containing protein